MYLLKFDWNPGTGIDLGILKIHYYSLMWLIAFALGYYIMKRIFMREKVKLEFLEPLFLYMIISTMLGARLGHVIFYQPELISEDFFSIFLPFKFKGGFAFTGFRGLASHGAAIGIIIGLILYMRKYKFKSLMWLFDRIIIPVAIGGAFVRIGNFINSEIIGKISGDFLLGVRFIQNKYHSYEIVQRTGIKDVEDAYAAVTSNPEFANLLEAVPYRHPAQLYEAFGYIVLFAILWFIYTKTKKSEQQGFIFGLFLVLLWTIRFFVEFVKEAQVDERAEWALNTGQWLSIPFVLFGLYLMFFYKSKSTAK